MLLPTTKNMSLAALVLIAMISSNCSDRQTIAASQESTAASNTGSSQAVAADETATPSDCTKKSSCDKATLVVKLVDMKTGGNIDELKGYSKLQVTWGIKVEPKKSASSGRKILIKIDNPPDELEVANKANTVVIMGSFTEETSGTLDVRSRDVDYCELHHSDPEECSDISVEIEDIDGFDSASYRIIQSTQDQAQAEAEQKAKSAQGQANMTNCMVGLFSVFTGNIGGAAGCVGAVAGGLGN